MIARKFRLWIVSFFALTLSPGCLSCLTPVAAPPGSEIPASDLAPVGCRNGLHIFFVDGVDPLDCGKMAGVRRYFSHCGFAKTWYAYPHHGQWIHDEIAKLRTESPDARVAVVAWDWGAPVAVQAIQRLRDEGMGVDLLFLLDPCGLNPDESVVCEKAFNVRAENLFSETVILSGCQNITLAGAGHCGLPSHPATIELLTKEFNLLALSVPMVEVVLAPGQPLVESAPSPRAVTISSVSRKDGWDFLKPRFQTAQQSLPVASPEVLPFPSEGKSPSKER